MPRVPSSFTSALCGRGAAGVRQGGNWCTGLKSSGHHHHHQQPNTKVHEVLIVTWDCLFMSKAGSLLLDKHFYLPGMRWPKICSHYTAAYRASLKCTAPVIISVGVVWFIHKSCRNHRSTLSTIYLPLLVRSVSPVLYTSMTIEFRST